MKTDHNNNSKNNALSFFFRFSIFLLVFSCSVFHAYAQSKVGDDQLINQFIASKNYASVISFDANNIKQFWTDLSVFSKDGVICILNKNVSGVYESVPLKLELVNLNDIGECKVEILTKTPDVSFSVLDSKHNPVTSSNEDDVFLQYHVLTAKFQIETAENMIFNLKFSSSSRELVEIDKIILSFTNKTEDSFWHSPGIVKLTRNNMDGESPDYFQDDNFKATARYVTLSSKGNVIVTDNTLFSTVKVKNVGQTQTRVFFGLSLYTKDGRNLNNNNYPYNNINNILTVISSEDNSNKILVDSYSEWAKRCSLAVNAKNDLSDVPNLDLVDGLIEEVKKLDNGQGEITLNKPLKKGLPQGAKIRIHGIARRWIYPSSYKMLQPGEEFVFDSKIQKDNNLLQYSPKAISKGVHSVKFGILSEPTDNERKEIGSIEISDFYITF